MRFYRLLDAQGYMIQTLIPTKNEAYKLRKLYKQMNTYKKHKLKIQLVEKR